MKEIRRLQMKLSNADRELIKLKEKVESAMVKNSKKRLKELLSKSKSTNLYAKLGSLSKTCHSSSVQTQ